MSSAPRNKHVLPDNPFSTPSPPRCPYYALIDLKCSKSINSSASRAPHLAIPPQTVPTISSKYRFCTPTLGGRCRTSCSTCRDTVPRHRQMTESIWASCRSKSGHWHKARHELPLVGHFGKYHSYCPYPPKHRHVCMPRDFNNCMATANRQILNDQLTTVLVPDRKSLFQI